MSATAVPSRSTSITERAWPSRSFYDDKSEVVSSLPAPSMRPQRSMQDMGLVGRRLVKISSLDVADWDGQGAEPIATEAVERAHRLVTHLVEAGAAIPDFTPLTDGGVRAEWDYADFELWLDVPARGEVQAYASWVEGGSEREFEDALLRAPAEVLHRLLTGRGSA